MTSKAWVDPFPYVIRDVERDMVVARAATEALAKSYAADSLDPTVQYKISKEKR